MKQIKFLGTAGARVVVTKQLRASAGCWLSLNNTNFYLDPGPGALVKTLSTKPKLDPATLSAIILSHKHLDHSNDINIMIEAMTEAGFKKRGIVFAPQDAIDSSQDPVIFQYVTSYVDKIEVLQPGKSYKINDVSFTTPVRHIHSVETYGFKFKVDHLEFSWIIDTRYFDELILNYQSEILIINIVFKERRDFDHLCIEDVEKIIKGIKPKACILTHFGMSILKSKPYELAKELSTKLKTKVIAAYDGMSVDLENI